MQLAPEKVILTGLELGLDPGGEIKTGERETAAWGSPVMSVSEGSRPERASGGRGQAGARLDFSVCALDRKSMIRIKCSPTVGSCSIRIQVRTLTEAAPPPLTSARAVLLFLFIISFISLYYY